MTKYAKIVTITLALALVICLGACDINSIIDRLPYDIESWHEHSWDNWELVYDDVNVNLVCSICDENVISYPISQGLEIENGVVVGRGSCEDEYIVVPQGVIAIGDGAFSYEKDILGVLLPENVTEIRDGAFEHCDSLQVINIPEGVTSIGDNAFFSCKALIGVLIPNSVKTIGRKAFSNCGYLEIIYYVGDDEEWNAVSKGKDWNKGAGKHVVEFKMVVGGDGENNIPEDGDLNGHQHYWSEWTVVEEATSEIEGYKERYCCECGEKEIQVISVKIPSQGLEYRLNKDGKSYTVVGYGSCMDSDIVIPAVYKGLPVTSISQFAFSTAFTVRSVELNSVELPSGILHIGPNAFLFSTITRIFIPSSVVTIADGAFAGCSNLSNIEVDENNAYYQTIDGNLYSIDGKTFLQYANGKKEAEFSIPDFIFNIGVRAFFYCTSLENIYIPDSVKYIRNEAFADCDSLTSINLSNNLEIIEDGVFMHCDSLKSIVIPDLVVSIGKNVFSNCYALTDIVIGNSVKYIGSYAFQACESLTNIEIPDSLECGISFSFYKSPSIKYNEYDNALYLGNTDNPYLMLVGIKDKNISVCNVHPNTKIISDSAFSKCSSLVYISIPDSLVYVGSSFSRLDDYYLEYNEYGNACYLGNANNPYLVLVKPKDPTYVKFEIHPNTKIISDSAFENCKSIKSIVIPDSVEIIGDNAFYWAESLTDVIIGNSVKHIGAKAFYDCYSLENLVFGNSIESIGEGAFVGCNALVEITIPDSVVYIGKSAFGCCLGLQYVTIPNSVTTMGDFVFGSCTSLTSIVIPESVTNMGEEQFTDCFDLVIYCEAESFPCTWRVTWNCTWENWYITVVWGYTGE